VPKGGGAAATLTATPQVPVALAIANGFIYWEEQGAGPPSADGTLGSQLRKVSVADGSVTTVVNGLLNGLIDLASAPPGLTPGTWWTRPGIVADATSVYFTTMLPYQVLRVATGGGDVTVLLADPQAPDANYPRDLVQDDAALYWIDLDSVKSIAKGGGAVALLAGGRPTSTRLALAGGVLYWTEQTGLAGAIAALPTGGGSPAIVLSAPQAPTSLFADAANLYWADGNGNPTGAGFGALYRSAPDGSATRVLVEAATGGPFCVDQNYLYFANGATLKRVGVGGGFAERLSTEFSGDDLVTDGAYLYWYSNAVWRLPVTGGPAEMVGLGNLQSLQASHVQMDAQYVYWMANENTVQRMAKSGGPVETVAGPFQGLLTDFAVDGVNVYLAEWDGRAIDSVPAGGGAVTALTGVFADQTRRIATDGISVYWIDQLNVSRIGVHGENGATLAGVTTSSPFESGHVAVDATGVYWTEPPGGAVMEAAPK